MIVKGMLRITIKTSEYWIGTSVAQFSPVKCSGIFCGKLFFFFDEQIRGKQMSCYSLVGTFCEEVLDSSDDKINA